MNHYKALIIQTEQLLSLQRRSINSLKRMKIIIKIYNVINFRSTRPHSLANREKKLLELVSFFLIYLNIVTIFIFTKYYSVNFFDLPVKQTKLEKIFN